MAKGGFREAAHQRFQQALVAAGNIDNENNRGWAFREIDSLQVEAVFGEQALTTSQAILADRHQHLPDLAGKLASVDKDLFKRLLLPCAYYLESAFRMCPLLARLFPERAMSVAEIVLAQPRADEIFGG